jgi:hypothetical protein
VTLADPSERKTKKIVRFAEREKLPRWFDDFRARMQPKNAVTVTNAHDGHQLIVLFREDEHAEMIALFFASKVWVLREQVDLDNVSIDRRGRLR